MRVGLIGLLCCAWLHGHAQTTVQWRTLNQTQEALGFTNCVWDGVTVLFSNETDTVRFYAGRRKVDVNGCTVWLNVLPEGNVSNGDWRLSAIDLDFIQLGMLTATNGAQRSLRVMLDAGHGGVDDGACSRTPFVMSEKVLTLDMVNLVGQRLEAAGMKVFYTRMNDVAVPLDERSLAARKVKADIFVSLHANFASNPHSSGTETFVINPAGYAGTPEGSRARGFQIGNTYDYYNTLLGYSLQRRLAEMDSKVPDRGLKRQSFFVLRETSCPAALVEIGFLSNAAELIKMTEPEWMDTCADAIAEGIFDYAAKVDALDVAVRERRKREFALKKAGEEKAKLARAANVAAKARVASTRPPIAPAVTAPASEPAPSVITLAATSEPVRSDQDANKQPEKADADSPPAKKNQTTVTEVPPLGEQPAKTNASPGSIFDFYTKK